MRVARFLVDLSGIEGNAGPDSYVRAHSLSLYGACANHCSGEQAERHLVSLYHKAGTLSALQARPTHLLWGMPHREWFVSPEIPPWSAVPRVDRVDRFVHATAIFPWAPSQNRVPALFRQKISKSMTDTIESTEQIL